MLTLAEALGRPLLSFSVHTVEHRYRRPALVRCGPDGFSAGALRCVGSGAGRVPLVSPIGLDSEPTRAFGPARSQHWPYIMNEMRTISRDSAALAGRSARWRGTSQRLGVFSVLSQQLAEPQARSLIRERGERTGAVQFTKADNGRALWGPLCEAPPPSDATVCNFHADPPGVELLQVIALGSVPAAARKPANPPKTRYLSWYDLVYSILKPKTLKE